MENGHVASGQTGSQGIDLSNGIVLCEIVNELEHNRIPLVRKTCITSLHKKENVRRYLSALRELGMPQSELLHEDDIVYLTNRHRVLEHVLCLFKFVKGK